MALTQIDFDEKEEKIIEIVSKEHKINKPKTVKMIVSKYKEERDGKK